ncbi:MAG: SMP-30/gluconolactonase/LRE family protein [Gemmatimonadota bacterium]
MNRIVFSIASLLLVLVIAADCSGYAAPDAPHDTPPDTTFADGLWASSGDRTAILRLSSSQLVASAAITPATAITSRSALLEGFNSVAFDAEGTLWVTSQTDSLLIAFRRPALASSGARVASRVISSSGESLTSPVALAFDALHALWVANTIEGTIVRFDSAQLAAGGAQTPSVILSGAGHPAGLAFDADGGLWFSEGNAHRIAKYSAAQLQASGRLIPQVVLTSNGPDLTNPAGLAFDRAGNLWVANAGLLNVVEIQANHLATTGFVYADVVLSPPAGFSSLPLGVTFDDHENLWVVYAEGTLTRYDHAVLSASRAPAPAVSVSINDHSQLRNAAFWPRPVGLPLQ